MSTQLSTQPYKGARDFYPEDMRVRNYIFNAWKKVCQKYGYEEYDGPFLESFDIYAAKSGQELVNEQIYSFTDRGDRKVAIRPEMTPTVARMVAQKFTELPRPIRWFSIPNLWRYEKPQKGRLREHYQLNVDIFGIEGVEADLEILSVYVDILKEVGAKDNMFEIRLNNRRLTEDVYKEIGISKDQTVLVNRAVDKKSKLSEKDFEDMLKETANLDEKQIKGLKNYLGNPTDFISKVSEKSQGAQEIKKLMDLAQKSGISKYIKLDPTVIRGLEYYTGNVFELYNMAPDNNRAMSGGGRYDNLVEMFRGEKLTGIGFGMGDVTFKDFLESWGLMPNLKNETEYLVTIWPSEDSKFFDISNKVAAELRSRNINTQIWPETNTKLEKQLKYADKLQIEKVIIIGEDELKNNTVTIKNMKQKTQETKNLDQIGN